MFFRVKNALNLRETKVDIFPLFTFYMLEEKKTGMTAKRLEDLN